MSETIGTIEEAKAFLEEVNAQRGLGGDVELNEEWEGYPEASLTWEDPKKGFFKNVTVSHYSENGYWYVEVNAWRDEENRRRRQYERTSNAPVLTQQGISEAFDRVTGWTEDRLTRVTTYRVEVAEAPPVLNAC